MKWFCRVCAGNTAVLYIFALFFPCEMTMSFSDMSTQDWFFLGWAGMTMVSGFLWLGYLFYHWAITQFSRRWVKVGWLFALVLGTMVHMLGPAAYYLAVIEMRRGLAEGPVTI